MSIQPVSDKLFEYLISNTSGERFEQLAKIIFGGLFGEEFIPLGGMHDGGADGFYVPHVYASKKPDTFFQFSVTDAERAKTKVNQTISSITKSGRDLRQLIYSTSELLPKQDILITEIFDKYGVLLMVRDRERLKQVINSNVKANRGFLDFYMPDIDAVRNSAKSLSGAVNQFVNDPTVFAFLDHELKDRFSKDKLHQRILDSLIYWALRDTDPDAGTYLDRPGIENAITSVFPAAANILIPHLNGRLKELSRKNVGDHERVRHHAKENKFCLPFEMRKGLAERALEESKLQEAFIESIKLRLLSLSREGLSKDVCDLGVKLIFSSVHEYFVEQGLILSAFLNNKVDTIQISDQIVEDQVAKVVASSKNKAKISPPLIADCLRVLRFVFYEPSIIERQYLNYLSRTSLMFMTLQTAPRMIEYFNQMGGNFRLLVGTDLLVKSISEQHLQEDKQQVGTLLRACNGLGAKLILTEPVLNEVFTHLHAVDLEYRNHYLPNEAYLSPDEISECDRILIRAYYYNRFGGGQRVGWNKFISTLLDPDELRAKSQKGLDQLRGLLVQRFNMDYISSDELWSEVVDEHVNALADKLKKARGEKHEELSINDALMVHVTYAQRRKHKESSTYDGFGYRTWWLTKETRVLSYTAELVVQSGGVPYIMRPEFLLNFIALAPNAGNVRKAFREILPTTTGLQLGQHLKPETMHQLLAGTEEWASLPPERVSVIIGDRVNRLKFDRFKRYTGEIII